MAHQKSRLSSKQISGFSQLLGHFKDMPKNIKSQIKHTTDKRILYAKKKKECPYEKSRVFNYFSYISHIF